MQAVHGFPLTVYGAGGQTPRHHNSIKDTLNCIQLSIENPPASGELRVFNQFTETFSVNELAKRVSSAAARLGIDVVIKSVVNPRKEAEQHYYNPSHTGLLSLGLKPHFMTEDVLVGMLDVRRYRDQIDESKFLRGIRWAWGIAMSAIRLLGIVLGTGIVCAALLYFRGHRWKRENFFLATVVGAGLLLVSVFPDAANIFRDLLRVGDFEYGRLLALLIISNIATFLLAIYTKAKLDNVKHLLDRSFRAMSIDGVEPANEIGSRTRAIMLIVPALNEAENLAKLLPRVPKQIDGMDVGVLVVDDGSSDATGPVALQNGCLVARNIVNRGQGAASRVGYGFLALHKATVGVTFDGDNQHDPNEIERLVRPILSGQYDLVIGSRVLGDRDPDSRVRYAGVILFSWMISLVIGTRITDCSSGFKAFRIDPMARLDLREDQFQSSEVLIAAAKSGLKIGEVPIHVRRREFGTSRKGTNLIYGLMWLKTMVRSWLR